MGNVIGCIQSCKFCWAGKVPKNQVINNEKMRKMGPTDEVFRNPQGAQFNKTLLEQTVHKDWNTRPNWLNPMGTDGPGREGLKKHLGLMTQMIRNVKVERKHMFLCGDRVVVLSKMSGEIGDVPSGFDEFPCFPGINPD